MLLSSHQGVITEDIEGRLRAFAAVVDARDRCILEMLDRPLTIGELAAASPICGRRAYAPGVLDYWEGQMIRRRFARLERRGWVRGDARADVELRGADGGRTGRLVGATAEADRFHNRARWLRR
jgi:hypothetical protein